MSELPEPTLYAIFTTSFLIGLTGSIQPGPLFALTVSQTAKRGFWAGPLLILGHGIIELALVIAVIYGLSQFLQSDTVLSVIGIVGGSILIAIGLYTAVKAKRGITIPSADQADTTSGRTLVFSGILISVANPYWIIWWAIMGLTYLTWSLKLGAIGVTTFFTGHILADLGWYALVSFTVVKGKKWLSDNTYKWLIFLCGLALVGLGAYFVLFVALGGSFLAE